MNFYIGDTHFGHANIMRLCQRPFNNVDEMNRTIIFNWNNRVSNDDIVYILGDFAYKSSAEMNPIDILRQLKGHKVLIEGNHDSKNLKNSVFCRQFEEIKKMDTIYEGKEKVVLCHYPIIEWDGYFRGSWHIFGHIHNNIKNNAYRCMFHESHALNAGADITEFSPVTFEELKVYNDIFKKNNKG